MTSIKDQMFQLITGRANPYLVPFENSPYLVHKECLTSLNQLKNSLEQKGHQLYLVSSYRSHADQLRIWNEKVEGKRLLLDLDGNPVSASNLSDKHILEYILRWSALPGASRHHWGSDIDVVDKNVLNKPENIDYKVELTPEEVNQGGMFFEFHQELSSLIENNESFDFFRPYEQDLGGVSPEPWHLSYKPVSDLMLEKFSFEIFLRNIEETNLLLKELVLDQAEHLYKNYVLNISDI